MTVDEHHVRHPPAAHRPGSAGLQRDRAGLAGVLRLPQRPGRHLRAQDPPDHQERRIQPHADGQRRRTNSCCRTTCSASSRAWARRPTPRSWASSTARKCPTCSSPRGARAGTTAPAQPYTFGWQPNYTIEGKILGQYIKQHFAGKKVGVFYQDDDFGNGWPDGHQVRAAGQPDRLHPALPAGRHQRRTADLRDQGGGRRSAGRLHRADLHRARPADVVHARLQTAAGRVQRGHRPDHRRRPAEDVLQRQGGNGTDRRRDHRRLPAVVLGNVEPVDRAVQKNPRPIRPERAV